MSTKQTTQAGGKLRLVKKTICLLNAAANAAENPTNTTLTGTGDTSNVVTCIYGKR